MSEAQPSEVDADDVALLATGFALGELEESELHRLYDLLRQPGSTGATVARIAWEVLGTTVDLRATLASRFQDTVDLRLAEAGTGKGQGFIASLLGRIGLERPRLGSVRVNPLLRQRSRWPWLIAGLAVGAVAVALWLWPRVSPLPVSVRSVQGQAMVAGRVLAAKDPLSADLVIVSAGSRLDLAWTSGHRVRLAGPATAMATADGLSLRDGTARLAAAGPFVLRLPERSAFLAAGSDLVVETDDRSTVLALAAGTARLSSSSADPGERTLTAGQAGNGRHGYAWTTHAVLTGEGDGRLLDVPADAAVWDLSFVLRSTGDQDQVELAAFAGAKTSLRLTPVAVETVNEGVAGPRHRLDGPPRMDRRCRLRRRPGGTAELTINEVAVPFDLPFTTPPRVWRIQGAPVLSQVVFHTGPPPLVEPGETWP